MAHQMDLRSAIVICVLIVILITRSAQGKQHTNAKSIVFHGAQNQGLVRAEYKRTEAASPVICVRDCHADPHCNSVNYCKCSQWCILNNVTQAERPGDFKEMQGSFYFDIKGETPLSSLPNDITCKTLLEAGEEVSGIYMLMIAQRQVQAYCDMTTDGGGWLVLQRRQDGSVDFYRNWAEYQAGFGDLSGEFWLGNDIIRNLTEFSCPWELRIELEDWDTSTAWAKYGEFRLVGDTYTLQIASYNVTSTAGDSLNWHNGNPFTTKDQDHDVYPGNCAVYYHGAWWYSWCHIANLNGQYYPHRSTNYFNGINWRHWTGDTVSLKKCSMKMREVTCRNYSM